MVGTILLIFFEMRKEGEYERNGKSLKKNRREESGLSHPSVSERTPNEQTGIFSMSCTFVIRPVDAG